MDCGTPGFAVYHQLLGPTQTHVHWVGDAIQPSHPLSSASPPAFNYSQHQDLFKWVSSLHQVAKVLEFQLQHQSWCIIFFQDWFPLGLTGLISLLSKGLSRIFSNTTIQKPHSTDSNLQSSGLWDLCIKSSHNCEGEVSLVPFYRWGNLAEKDRASIWNYFWSGVVTACFIQSSKRPYKVDILERRKLRFWEMNYPEDL